MPSKTQNAKLNLKDRKILYQLDLNSRQSLSSIGKQVGLPKNVVAYRIKRLQKEGLIKNFYTVIDASKLGYISFRFYLTFQYTTPEIEKEIIEYFVKNEYTYWIGTIEGRFDLVVIMWIKDLNDFYSFWEETLKRYRDYFQDQIFSIYFQLLHYRYSYLLEEKDLSKRNTDRTNFEITGGGKRVEIDNLDREILKIIAPNPRLPITEIAKKLDSTVTIINYRIKRLIKSGIIQGFRTNIDFSKLGYQYFKVDIYLKDYKKVDKIISYIKFNPNLIYIDKTAGLADLEAEFHIESLEKLQQIMNDLVVKFPYIIKNFKYFNMSKVIKMHYMPEK